jgi:hypothetical protein
MTTRRSFLMGIGALGAGAAAVKAEDLCAVYTKATQSATTATQALDRLKEGNARFVAGHRLAQQGAGELGRRSEAYHRGGDA